MGVKGLNSRYINVDGIRTHYFEAGKGPTVVFLHSGEFGGCAELSWEFNLPSFARHFHVVAPDWLGFGLTDKVFDFASGRKRVFSHMRRFLEVMDIKTADFVGNSMGGSNLIRIAADPPPIFPIRSIVASSGGGFAPASDDRAKLLAYDGTTKSMRNLLDGLFYNKKKWVDNPAYIRKRQKYATLPGAWECAAAVRFKRPNIKFKGSQFGGSDSTPYENIDVPVLLVAGKQDGLRLPGYAKELKNKIRGSKALVYDQAAHCPHIEHPARFNKDAIHFLKNIHKKLGVKRV
ncbi:MAG: alpha/beta hydrolase [Rhodospirillaceae bacterium]|nr:alpha/beta hydrolase [Rhodospirillaceae bacterium]|tara:strand:- start:1641 stop:2510 length:870 start_codon:yes stop_codon:yes gene_type:complete